MLCRGGAVHAALLRWLGKKPTDAEVVALHRWRRCRGEERKHAKEELVEVRRRRLVKQDLVELKEISRDIKGRKLCR